ncbi:MAG TPA: PilZ domain-containing protein [Terriglobales bacterium]|nr:PilZ domain-containing protein [Terriglobales bacterium]
MLAVEPERRRMKRCDLQEPVTIKYWDHGPRETTGVVQNASPDGVFLESDRELPQRSHVELVFLFPASLRSPGVRFVCQCRIVRRIPLASPGKYGLAMAIVRTESERLGRQAAQEQESWRPSMSALVEL